MLSLPIGMIAIAIVLFFSIDFDSISLYVNQHAIVIVIGGTIAILAMSTPTKVLRSLVAAVISLYRRNLSIDDFIAEIQQLGNNRNLQKRSKNPLLNHASNLWSAGVDPELFIVLMSQKRVELETTFADAVVALRNLAKYPPALGMTGTVIGLVNIFSNLDSGIKSLGPALALAMTATFFGLIMANAFIMPLADRLHVQHMMMKRLYAETYQQVILINRGESPELVRAAEVEKHAA